MTLISGLIPNMINGVSQQPQSVRNPSQAERQLNMMSTASRGLRKRPASFLTATINGQFFNPVRASIPFETGKEFDWAFHAYKRTETEQYHFAVHGPTGKVRITNLNTGIVRELSDTYFVCSKASENIKFLTVADTTFVLNTERTVDKSGLDTAPLTVSSANISPNRSDLYVMIDIGNYAKTYRIEVNFSDGTGFFVTRTTASGGSAADAADISTDTIAENLRNTIQNQLTTTGRDTNVKVARYGSVLHIYVVSTSPYYISDFALDDGFAGQAMTGFNQIVDDFAKLPSRASARSSPVKVVEGADKGNKGYYVRFEADGASADGRSGVWRECASLYADPEAGHSLPAPGSTTPRLSAGLDPADMPRIITNTGVNLFTVGQANWTRRLVGDSVSAPDPSFVGKKISGMFFHRNRLGFLCEDGITLSEANNFFNLYPTTVIQVVDKDPIDIKANTTVVDNFHSASPFDRDLFVFGERTQYRLSGEPLLTPKTAEMKLVTSYENDNTVAPSAVGNRIMFATTRGVYSAVRELYITNDNTLDAPLVTGVVPEYIPARCRCLATSSTDDVVALVAPSGMDVYLYSFFMSGNEKLMSSWSTWRFRGLGGQYTTPMHAVFLGSNMYVTVHEGVAIRILKVDLSFGDTGTLGSYRTVHLDNAFRLTPSSYSTDPVRGLTLAQNLGSSVVFDNATLSAVISSPTDPRAGQEVPVKYVPDNNGTLEFEADLVTNPVDVIVGARFDAQYELSTIYLRRTQGQSVVADTLAKLRLRKVTFVYEDSPRFAIDVTPEGRPTRTSYHPPLSTVTTRGWEGTYAYPATDGRFSCFANTKNEKTKIVVWDNGPHPLNLLSATWEATYARDSKAV